jgi:Methane oxygenase PmoA
MKAHLSLIAFALTLPALAVEPAPVQVKLTDTTFDFMVGDELVARYHKGPEVAKPYFWPLNAPGGVPVTRGWPMQKGLPKETADHVHQKSAWFCHGDVIPEGIELKQKVKGVTGVDFWSETPNHGKIVCVSVGEPVTVGAATKVATNNEWRTADGIKILDEVRVITVRDLGDTRLIVLEIDLHASVCPITFGDTKEGSMGVRVNDEIKVKGGNGTYMNAAGETNEKGVWGRRSDWNDYFGKVGDATVGIAVFDDPRNKQRSCWHSREYGLMSANPFGRNGAGFPDVKGQTELVKLAKGDHLKLRYGILLHRGDAKAGKVAEHFAAFAKD